jgi:hypothetical protein
MENFMFANILMSAAMVCSEISIFPGVGHKV